LDRRRLLLLLSGLLALLLVGHTPIVGGTSDTLPQSLTDKEFWSLTEQLSEPNGYFKSNSGSPDNLLSNENTVSIVATALRDRVKPSGVYLGVGPEQNFTYITAMRPRMAFITDIRRGNLHLHLLYKALFETSVDRVEFVGRLFNRVEPRGFRPGPGPSAKLGVDELMTMYLSQPPVDEAAFKASLSAVTTYLMKTRNLPLSADDIAGIEYVYRNFYRFGPAINYVSSINGNSGMSASYARIQMATDRAGEARTYLASEGNFALVKGLEKKNLIVPIVGDFAGPKALRAVGAWLKQRGAIVSAFYVSNVEGYLQRAGVWEAFCGNVATMPIDASSVFIRPSSGRTMFGGMSEETRDCRRMASFRRVRNP
jgi:hypothetical protein